MMSSTAFLDRENLKIPIAQRHSGGKLVNLMENLNIQQSFISSSSFHPIQSIQQRDAESPYSLFHRNIQTSPQQRFSPNVDWASNHVANQVSKSDLKYQTLPITPNISPQEPDLVQQSHFPTGYSATPPAGYVCKLCFVDGHWLRNCTLYLERKQGNIQHQKFMQELESPANALLSEQVKMQLSVQSQQFHLGSSRLKTFPPDGYVCRKCNIVGHWIQQCPNQKMSIPPSTYCCRACGIKGHWIYQCSQVSKQPTFNKDQPKKLEAVNLNIRQELPAHHFAFQKDIFGDNSRLAFLDVGKPSLFSERG